MGDKRTNLNICQFQSRKTSFRCVNGRWRCWIDALRCCRWNIGRVPRRGCFGSFGLNRMYFVTDPLPREVGPMAEALTTSSEMLMMVWVDLQSWVRRGTAAETERTGSPGQSSCRAGGQDTNMTGNENQKLFVSEPVMTLTLVWQRTQNSSTVLLFLKMLNRYNWAELKTDVNPVSDLVNVTVRWFYVPQHTSRLK